MTTFSTTDAIATVEKLAASYAEAGFDMEAAFKAKFAADEEREFAERRASRDAILAESDASDAIAQSTPCDFPGCDGGTHEGGLNPSEWYHGSEHSFHDDLITVSIGKPAGGAVVAHVNTWGAHPETTAADLRNMADAYESFPAWLRARADELDALNA